MIIPGIIATSGAAGEPPQAPSDPVAWWKFEEAATPLVDSVGSYDFDNWSGSTLNTQEDGKVNYCIEGVGTHNLIGYGTTPPLGSTGLTDYTFICWVYCTVLPVSATDYIFEQAHFASGDTNFRIWVDTSGYISMRTSPGGTLTTTTAITLNTWFQLAISADNSSGETRFYFDTTLVNTLNTNAYSGSQTMNRTGILNNMNASSRPFDGFLDEMIIYDYGLTGPEITRAYNRANAGYPYYNL